jgi:hypothetical protein
LRPEGTPWKAVLDAERDCAEFIEWEAGASLEQHVLFKREARLRAQESPRLSPSAASPVLDAEQLAVLKDLVRRALSIPREQRKFEFHITGKGPFYRLQVIPSERVPVAEMDIAALRRGELIEFISDVVFVLTPGGMQLGSDSAPAARSNNGWHPEAAAKALADSRVLRAELEEIEAQDAPTIVVVFMVRPAVETASDLIGVLPDEAPDGTYEEIIGAEANAKASVRLLQQFQKVAERGSDAEGLLSLAERGLAIVRAVSQVWP